MLTARQKEIVLRGLSKSGGSPPPKELLNFVQVLQKEFPLQKFRAKDIGVGSKNTWVIVYGSNSKQLPTSVSLRREENEDIGEVLFTFSVGRKSVGEVGSPPSVRDMEKLFQAHFEGREFLLVDSSTPQSSKPGQGPWTPKVFHSARLRTKDEISDKANAALALIQGIDISGDDARIIKKIEILLEDIVELQEGSSWF